MPRFCARSLKAARRAAAPKCSRSRAQATTSRVRQYAIRYIGELKDAASLDELIRIYDADKTKEIRFQIIRALAERDDPRARAKLFEIARQGETPELRIEAIRRLGDHGRIAMDDLLQLYTGETNVQIKQGLLRAFADNNDPRAQRQAVRNSSWQRCDRTARLCDSAVGRERRRANRRSTRFHVRR